MDCSVLQPCNGPFERGNITWLSFLNPDLSSRTKSVASTCKWNGQDRCFVFTRHVMTKEICIGRNLIEWHGRVNFAFK